MKVWAIADLHLSFAVPGKSMEFFGPIWKNYTEKIRTNWLSKIKEEDLILIAGDISWGMKTEEATADFNWLKELPGIKILVKGNHDYWWTSLSKLNNLFAPSFHFIQNNSFNISDLSIAGTRLWETPEYNFSNYIQYKANPNASSLAKTEDNAKIFERELKRLKTSLSQLNPKARIKIAMCHYPPIGAELKDSSVSKLLEEYKIDFCVFGHLHQLDKSKKMFGEKNGVKYLLTSADYLDFNPLLVC